jgi:hypothetical protein
MTSGPTGLKIDWFETQPSPGFDRLAPASRRRESKMLFHQRNKKVVAATTQNRPLHDHSPSPSASAFVIGRAPACGGPSALPAAISHNRAAAAPRAAMRSCSIKGGDPHDPELCLPEALAIASGQHWAA